MNAEDTKQTPPSKEEITKFYKEQIEIAKMRKELSLLNAEISEYEARRIEAIARAAHFSKPQPDRTSTDGEPDLPPGVVEHIVTAEDLENNPELISEGIKVGDRIGITAQPATPSPVKEERKLKKVED
jgi:hypothetical protein